MLSTLAFHPVCSFLPSLLFREGLYNLSVYSCPCYYSKGFGCCSSTLSIVFFFLWGKWTLLWIIQTKQQTVLNGTRENHWWCFVLPSSMLFNCFWFLYHCSLREQVFILFKFFVSFLTPSDDLSPSPAGSRTVTRTPSAYFYSTSCCYSLGFCFLHTESGHLSGLLIASFGAQFHWPSLFHGCLSQVCSTVCVLEDILLSPLTWGTSVVIKGLSCSACTAKHI